MYRLCFYFLAQALCVLNLSAQKNNYINHIRLLSVEDGMASREVLCGLQDKHGFIWLGTRSGLNRYDGKNFILFNKHNSGLRENRVIQVAKDDSCYLWIIHGQQDRMYFADTRVDILDINTNEIAPLHKKIKNIPFIESEVVWCGTTRKGELAIHTSKGQVFYWSAKNGFRRNKVRWKVYNENISQMAHGQADLLLKNYSTYSYQDSVYIYPMRESENGTITTLIYRNKYKSLSLCQLDREGKKAGDDLSLLSSDTGLFKTVSRNSTTAFYDALSNTSILHSNNSHILSFRNGSLFYLMTPQQTKSYPHFTTYSYFMGREGNCWICTSTGVFIIRSEKNRFTHYFTDSEVSVKNFNGNQARGIYADSSGNIYANVWDHFLVYKKPTRQLTDTKNPPQYPLLFIADKLWSGGVAGLLYYEAGAGKKIQVLNNVITGNIWSLFNPYDSLILCGGENGIFRYNCLSKTLADCNDTRFPLPHLIYKIMRSRDGKLWAAGKTGLYELNDRGQIKDYFGPEAKNQNSRLPFNDLHDVYEDSQGTFWLATDGNGVYCWDRKNEVRQLTIANGLSSNLIYCIQEDNLGYIWLSSDYGLIRYDPLNDRAGTFTTKEGLTHNEFNRVSAFKAANGQLFFGGLNGVNSFNPEDFVNDSVQFRAPLQIVSLNVFSGKGNKLIDGLIGWKAFQRILLEHYDKFFTVEYMLLDFEEGQHRYAYRLDGIDKDWNYTSENTIRFSNLPYGEFVLHIKGQNSKGEWSTQQLHLPILVSKPFFLKTWFIILVASLVGLMLLIIIRWRTYQLRREKEKLELIIKDRTEELSESLEEKEILLKEIHHRVKNNLQVISSLLELHSSSIEDETARAALVESQNRIQSISLIHHKLYQNDNLASIELSGYTSELYRQVSGLFKKPFQQVSAEINIEETYVDIDTAVPLGLIINELIINIFKYALSDQKEGKIEIYLSQGKEGCFKLTVQDNGPGMPEGFEISKSRSLGLRLIKRLSKQIGGSVEYIYENGSKFIISFKNSEARNKSNT